MTKQYITDLTSEEALCETLNTLIKEATNEGLFEGDELELVFGENIDGEFTPFEYRGETIENPEGSAVFEDSDAAFFQAACSFDKSLGLVIDFMNLLIAHNEEVGEFEVAYKHDEEAFGLVPALALMQVDVWYTGIYGQFLKTLDADHFVNETTGVFYAFEKHGCDLSTLNLLALALFPASGQHSSEMLEYLDKNYPIDAFLEDEDNFEIVSYDMVQAFKKVHESHQELYSDLYTESASSFKNGEDSQLYKAMKEVEVYFNNQKDLSPLLLNQGFQEFTTDKEALAEKKVFKLSKIDKKAIVLQDDSITTLPSKETFKSLGEHELIIIFLFCRLITSDFKLISPKGTLDFEICSEGLKKTKEEYDLIPVTKLSTIQKVKLTRVIEAWENITSKMELPA